MGGTACPLSWLAFVLEMDGLYLGGLGSLLVAFARVGRRGRDRTRGHGEFETMNTLSPLLMFFI